MSPKPWENAEGYADPTAYNAIKKVSAEGHEALVWDLLRATLLVVTWPVWWLHEEVLGR